MHTYIHILVHNENVFVNCDLTYKTEELMLLNCGAGEDLRVPWTARRSNQSILKEISPGISLEGMIKAETPVLWPPDAKS